MFALVGGDKFVHVGRKTTQLQFVTAQDLVTTHKDDAIATCNQMALFGKGQSILSCLQMETYGDRINARSRLYPGGHHVILVNCYLISFSFNNSLPYL